MSENTISLNLDKDIALVLFELLSRECDELGFDRIAEIFSEDADLWALNGLLNALEKTLVEPLGKDYSKLLKQAASNLVERCGKVQRNNN